MSEVTTKKAEIGLHVQSLAELIKSDAKVSKADATGKIEVTVGDDLYARSLPEGITKEIVEQVQSHNAAFAAVVLQTVRRLGIDPERVNVNGGSIALGHPLGATGAILLGTVLDELERRDASTAVITMCIGGGQGVATVIERG